MIFRLEKKRILHLTKRIMMKRMEISRMQHPDHLHEAEPENVNHQPPNEDATTYKRRIKSIVYSKKSVHYNKNPKLYFVDPKGNPLEKGASFLFKNNKVKKLNNYSPTKIEITCVNHKFYIGLCLKNNKSQIEKIKN